MDGTRGIGTTIVEKFKTNADELKLKGRSLDSLIDSLIDGWYQLEVVVPTFRLELGTQNYIWSQLSPIGEVKLCEDRIKKVRNERLKRLPAAQMERIGEILDQILEQERNMLPQLPTVSFWAAAMASTRESALKHLAANECDQASLQIWYLAFAKERLVSESTKRHTAVTAFFSRSLLFDMLLHEFSTNHSSK